ncbi:alpha-2Db adrenergic receptor-like [Ostrea edulis]|uniref:alpha-2Db adrenergic receptor-like n=1 Tax=Ostrea edulis TaxID=37623 RepID=UPI0020945767|nr:alpha-2Db adrenergic receptor-like [Ostrea edulis]
MNLETWNSELSDYLVGNNIVLCLYLILGVFGNGLVILIYVFRMSKKSDDRYFIPSLAAVDACSCIIGSSYALALNLLPVRFPGNSLCRILWFFSQASTMSGGTLLMVIAFQRYLKVCRPFFKKWSLKIKRMVIWGTVTVATILSIPTLFLYGEIRVVNESYSSDNITLVGYRCGHSGKAGALLGYNVFLFVFAVSGIIVITICYIFIGKTIYSKVMVYRKSLRGMKTIPRPELSVSTISDIKRKTRSVETSDPHSVERGEFEENPSNLHDHESSDNQRPRPEDETTCTKRKSQDILLKANFPAMKYHFRHYRYSYMFMTITMVFVIAYLPRIVIMLLESVFVQSFWRKPDSVIIGLLFLYRLYIVNHVVNPFIYGFFDAKFRHEVKRLICRHKSESIHPDSQTGR